ncbi:uncharacterized protein DFL_006326 [Arthrobotrys flagrans]|uniref:tRNA pseudouridine(55) synthase n=1 Tax=Arthrobotrys flagrans TaxID=97331 RepID=A0A437A0P3_ARTFL|nr:hypothetical protein DFL_006326 [Arthrobotrys flagrans]
MVTDGIIAVNKPAGRTSAQVLRNLQVTFGKSEFFADHLEAQKAYAAHQDKRHSYTRRSRKNRKGDTQVKLGHGGTLDPMATGVLIVGVGNGTKRLSSYLDCTKEYEAVAIFGISTDTYDKEGQITARKPYGHITKEAVEGVLDKFRGDICQRPPMFSALNLNGKRLYEYAREGIPIPVEIKKRPCTISSLEITKFEAGDSGHEWEYPTREASEVDKAAAKAYQELGMGVDKEEDLKSGIDLGPNAVSDQEFEAAEKRKATAHAVRTERLAKRSKKYYDQKNGIETPQEEKKEGEGEGEAESEREPTPPPPPPVYHEEGKPPVVHLKMTVSRGTYVRSIAHDIGEALGSAATLVALTRSRQGEYELGKNVIAWEDFKPGNDAWVEQVKESLAKSQEDADQF